jgi:hypothetical protein
MYNLAYFADRVNRDRRFKELRDAGVPVTRRTVRNQVLCPDAVEDYDGYTSPNGFGGHADRFFARLYTIEYGC